MALRIECIVLPSYQQHGRQSDWGDERWYIWHDVPSRSDLTSKVTTEVVGSLEDGLVTGDVRH